MEFKWLMIMLTLSFSSAFVAIGVEDYNKTQEHISAINAGLQECSYETTGGDTIKLWKKECK
jgi:hypothetical protein